MLGIMGNTRTAKLVALIWTCLSATGCGQQYATLTVDPTEHHQTIAGWEATAKVWEFDKVNDRFDGSWLAQRDELAAMLVDEAGIDRLRLEIKSGIENPIDYWALFAAGRIGYHEYFKHFYEKINDNADPATLNAAGIHFSDLDWRVENIVLPVKQRVEARGRRFRLNLTYVDFNWTEAKGTLSHAKKTAEYAELIAATFSHLKTKYALVPDSLEVILEPDNTDDWDGIAIGKAIVAATARLDATGFPNVGIIAPSTAKAQRALSYYDDIRRVPGAAQRMTTLSYHRYNREPAASDLGRIRDAANAAGMSTAMLEYTDGGIDDLLADLTRGDASAWQQYSIADRVHGDDDARPGNVIVARDQESGPPLLTLSPMARVLALIFNNVDPSSIRVAARSTNANIAAVGFLTPKRKLVVVLKAGRDVSLTIAGLPHGRYRLTSARIDGPDTKPHIVKVDGALNLPVTKNTTYALVEL